MLRRPRTLVLCSSHSGTAFERGVPFDLTPHPQLVLEPRMRTQRILAFFFIAIVPLLLMGQQPLPTLKPVKTGAVYQALITPVPGLTLVSAHRGLWRDYPENSQSAFIAAYEANFEIIEVDVRTDYANECVLIHDFNLDRETDVSGSIYSSASSGLTQHHLRDRIGRVTAEPIITLHSLLDSYYIPKGLGGYGPVLMVDVKGPPPAPAAITAVTAYSELKTCYNELVQAQTAHNLQNNGFAPVLFKMYSQDLPSVSQLKSDFPYNKYANLNLVVMFNNHDTNLNASVANYQNIGSHEALSQRQGDQLDLIRGQLQAKQITVGDFSPTADYAEGVSKADGGCCYISRTYPSASPPANSPLDYREQWPFMTDRGFNVIVTDYPDQMINFLAKVGARLNRAQIE